LAPYESSELKLFAIVIRPKILLEPAHLDLHCRRRLFSDDRPNHIDYRIVEKLGGDGIGVCYRSEDTKLGGTLAS
jgi:hypothetical protein